jgi:PmbA protein
MEQLPEIVDMLLALAKRAHGVNEVEAYVSRNTMTSVRVETLRPKGRTVGPFGQQLFTLQNWEASIKVVINKAVGVFSTNYMTRPALQRAVDMAVRNARAMAPDPDFVSLARPTGKRPVAIAPDPRILKGDAGPTLVDQVEAATALIDEKDLDLAGSVMAVSAEVCMANTNGVSIDGSADTFTVAALTAERVDGPEVVSSGVGWSSSRKIKQLDACAAAQDALTWARMRPERKTAPPGEYNVILGPYAVADLFDNMLSNALSLDRVYYGWSWLPSDFKELPTGKKVRVPRMNERIASEAVTIIDDPTMKAAMGSRTYDDEGLPTYKKVLIEKGELKEILSSSYYANLYGRESTASGFRYGLRPGRLASCEPSSYPTNLIMPAGDWTYDELIEESKGPTLVIPRTWYTYPTRYGGTGFSSSNRSTCFLIEKGKAVPVAPNAFKLSGDIRKFLDGVQAVGKDVKVATTWAASSAFIVPHVLSSGIRVEKPQEQK